MLRSSFIFVSCLSVLFVFFPAHATAKSVRAEISPKKIDPGDAFVIKVKGIKSAPSASFAGRDFDFSGCGRGCYLAVGAAGLETKDGIHTIRLKIGKRKRNLRISVRKTQFPSLTLTLPEDKVILSPEDLERTKRENERLAEVFQTVSDRMWDGSFLKPLENELSTEFGTKRIMNGKWESVHKGIDIKGKEGEEVKASNSGRVVLAGELFFGGNTIVIDHGQGIFTISMHLSEMKVKAGDNVSKGEVIGLVGSTGRATGPHLHFGAKVANIPVNPVSLTKLKL